MKGSADADAGHEGMAMALDPSLDVLLREIYSLDRQRCKEKLQRMQRPKLDFTEEFLDQMSIDRLRHVLAAACIQSRRPQVS